MPITQSAKKASRQSLKRKSKNDYFKAIYREARISFEKAIKASDAETAKKVFFNEKKDGKTTKAGLQAILDKLVKKNIMHENTASRRKSKYSKMLKTLELSAK
nr:30S ribosomal protein S20 [Candidatus Gracilibacteria bacterium]